MLPKPAQFLAHALLRSRYLARPRCQCPASSASHRIAERYSIIADNCPSVAIRLAYDGAENASQNRHRIFPSQTSANIPSKAPYSRDDNPCVRQVHKESDNLFYDAPKARFYLDVRGI